MLPKFLALRFSANFDDLEFYDFHNDTNGLGILCPVFVF